MPPFEHPSQLLALIHRVRVIHLVRVIRLVRVIHLVRAVPVKSPFCLVALPIYQVTYPSQGHLSESLIRVSLSGPGAMRPYGAGAGEGRGKLRERAKSQIQSSIRAE